jgi:lipopolysaccharide export system protein LptC
MNRIVTDSQTAPFHWDMKRGSRTRGESDRAFRAARRHSRWVRLLRVFIPTGVVASLVIVILITYLNPLRVLAKLPININDLVISGTKIKMEQPRLSGFTRDSRAYELSAEAAAQDLTKPDIVELHNLHAKVGMQDNSTMQMTAVSGVYNSKKETLKLEREIQLSSSSGYQGHLSEATVDIRKGNVVSDKPVELKMLQGTLNANKLEIVDSGDLVRFHSGVVMDMMLNNKAALEKKEAEAK